MFARVIVDTVRWAALLLLAACGRFGFDPVSGADLDAGTCVASQHSTEWDSLPTWAAFWKEPAGTTATAEVIGGTLRIVPSAIDKEWAGIMSISRFDAR